MIPFPQEELWTEKERDVGCGEPPEPTKLQTHLTWEWCSLSHSVRNGRRRKKCPFQLKSGWTGRISCNDDWDKWEPGFKWSSSIFSVLHNKLQSKSLYKEWLLWNKRARKQKLCEGRCLLTTCSSLNIWTPLVLNIGRHALPVLNFLFPVF